MHAPPPQTTRPGNPHRSHPCLAIALLSLSLALMTAADATPTDDTSPFGVSPAIRNGEAGRVIEVTFTCPPEHHLYADELNFQLNSTSVEFLLPQATSILNRFGDGSKQAFAGTFVASLPLPEEQPARELTVNLRGCNPDECYFPESRAWRIAPDLTLTALDSIESLPTAPALAPHELLRGFRVVNQASGYLDGERFMEFLERTSDSDAASTAGALPLAGLGPWAMIAAILLGGLALNLTPCVLPMIPINLAILGAGSQGSSRQRGFALGLTYGLGMALAYGGLGLVVVLTGSKFGTLNSSVWFNVGMAIVFGVLGLAMFDKLVIDLSRFQRNGRATSRGGTWIAAASMGCVSALLAGACVAPVVISVLLLGTQLYHDGNVLGLALPFVLGLGMALPWPFAGAGLSFLPKPGLWMNRVKHAFGIFIFAFAAYYAGVGGNLMWTAPRDTNTADSGSSTAHEALQAALTEARQTGRPVVIDCWASWCKNCRAMEHTTFQEPAVQQRLADFVFVRFQAERLNDPGVKGVLDELGVLGLPTYVMLSPTLNNAEMASAADAAPPSTTRR